MILPNGFLKTCGMSFLLLALALLSGRCGDKGEGPHTDFTAVFEQTGNASVTAGGYASDLILRLTGPVGTSYTITVTEGGAWCWTSRLNQTATRSGTLTTNPSYARLYLATNTTEADRDASITVAFDGAEPIELVLRQRLYDVPASVDKAWAELPAYEADADWQYVVHFAPLSASKTARNFTLCYDKKKGIANWVAYPIHDCYMQGSYSRSNAWGYDPEVEARYQADLDGKSYRGGVRGHQCMSNHRYGSYRELNAQTYYSTNIMPQDYDFNSGSWLSMESAATRNSCADTLYLVTGTYGVRGYATDQNNKQIAIPEYCWKVLLRTRSGRTGKRIGQITDPSELMAIGFWAANSYASKNGLKEYLVSVKEIEDKTGFVFFPMLDGAVAAEVKAQNNPSQWGIN